MFNFDWFEVCELSVWVMSVYVCVMDGLGLVCMFWNLLLFYGGKGGCGVELVVLIFDLFDLVWLWLGLENDEWVYSFVELLFICEVIGMLLVFDVYYYVVYDKFFD